MSIIQGYTSSEDEGEDINEVPQSIEPPTKKLKTFSGTFQNLPNNNQQHDDEQPSRKISKEAKKLAKQLRNKRHKKGNDPWANPSLSSDNDNEPSPAEPAVVESVTEPSFKPTSEFVGSEEFDYQGRTYMTIPKKLNIDSTKPHECFVPKKIIHKFSGHQKGVNKLQFFPHTGHLLLSCGNDSLIKLWSIYPKYELLRIFKGHTMAVKDIIFNSDGTKFLSCGYDKRVHLWDTQSGEVLKTIHVQSMPNVILFNSNNENEFIIGLSNFKIEHYDMGSITGFPIQTYDHHQGAINELVPLGKDMFISSADDKTVRFWKWQINIPEKVITDPSQHSMPSIKVHPTANYIALQSMDNSVRAVHSYGKFKWVKSKVFRGHQVAGYGIEIGFSPDGKILMSGDSKGYAYFWDWKTTKVVNRLKVSDKPVSCLVFHPQETSKVASAGKSGEIYYCD